MNTAKQLDYTTKKWPTQKDQPKAIIEFHNRLQQLLKKHS